ncbi:hypothetical protein MTO96_032937 [Rhipicephalus appendiculatus]
MAVRAVPATFAAAFAFLEAAYDGHGRRRREAEDAFDMPDDQFRRHFRLTKETVSWLCDEVADELKGSRPTALSVERQVLCALRFFATGSFQSSVGREETVAVTQPAVSNCVRRMARAIVNAGTRNKWVHFPRTPEEKADLYPASSDALTVASSPSLHRGASRRCHSGAAKDITPSTSCS